LVGVALKVVAVTQPALRARRGPRCSQGSTIHSSEALKRARRFGGQRHDSSVHRDSGPMAPGGWKNATICQPQSRHTRARGADFNSVQAAVLIQPLPRRGRESGAQVLALARVITKGSRLLAARPALANTKKSARSGLSAPLRRGPNTGPRRTPPRGRGLRHREQHHVATRDRGRERGLASFVKIGPNQYNSITNESSRLHTGRPSHDSVDTQTLYSTQFNALVGRSPRAEKVTEKT